MAQYIANENRIATRGLALRLAGEIAPQWDLVAGYAYMDGKIVASPDDLTVLPGDSVIRSILDYLCLSYWVVFYRVHACLLGSYACKELVE